ncbi:elongation factor P [Sphingobacteriales bacterium UPWRP_1]|nr:elongation factor P [Sphingobacteriales bacterium TSM_CSS]PSJ78934.1 elongation factor P [Sphingobacteriales bacterium UPWRP_1]
MATTADFKNGFCMEIDDNPWQIIEFLHVKPGKGPAFVRTKLRNLASGKIVDKTFPSGHTVKDIRIERRPYQYLYQDDSGFHFMNNETFDQVTLPEVLINAPQFLQEGMPVEITFHAEKELPLICELPPFVVLEVTYSEPAVRGDTANSVRKPATLENGYVVTVPSFVDVGTKIKIDTRTGEYIERVKE